MAQPIQARRHRSRQILIFALGALIVLCLVVAVIFMTQSKPGSHEAAATGSSPTTATQPSGEPAQAAPTIDPSFVPTLASIARNDPNDPRAKGDINAPVVMILMSDYSCPMCARYSTTTAPQLEPLIEDGTLRIEFHDFAIFADKYQSSVGAAGGIAAAKQGRFWEYLDAAEKRSAADHPVWSDDLAVTVAEEAGVADLNRFRADLTAQPTKEAVTRETQMLASIGLQGTPAFFINTRYLAGAQDVQVFLDTIAAAKTDGRAF